jgi:hypothetical protein
MGDQFRLAVLSDASGGDIFGQMKSGVRECA